MYKEGVTKGENKWVEQMMGKKEWRGGGGGGDGKKRMELLISQYFNEIII